MSDQAKPSDMHIASDVDHEVKLLAERTGLSPEQARDLINTAGGFAEAIKAVGKSPQRASPRRTPS